MTLAIEAVGKSFPGVRALDNVSMTFAAGEVHALMGENGAGKSTLIKIITGLHAPDQGRLVLDGKPVSFASAHDALTSGIGAVQQERNLVPRFSVGENIMLWQLPTRRGLVDYDAIDARARDVLNQLDPSIDTRTPVDALSVAQMQLVEIAKALALNARVLLLDEPTASITDHEVTALFAILRRLRAQGVAIVFVSHKLEEVLELSDRVSVLRDGKVVAANEPVSGIDRRRLVSLMIGREERAASIARPALSDRPHLALNGVSTSFGHRNVGFTLHEGEILGLYGLVGAGRTELAQAIIGKGRVTAGEIRLKGEKIEVADVHEAITKYRIGYVSEDRKGVGLILSQSVETNIAMTIWRRLANALGFVPDRAQKDAVLPFFRKLDVKAPSMAVATGTLSGGNQQKVSVAKWLAANTDILIIDEPTVGIDVKTKAEIHEIIGELAAGGISILLISSDMAEMIALADRVLVLHGFGVVGEIANDHDYSSTSQAIMAAIHAADPSLATSPGHVHTGG
jgi:ribose transport system ATP-binding protein